MPNTIPAAGGDYTDIASDASTYVPGTFRNLHRFLEPYGVKTERCTVINDQWYYKGHLVRLFGTTLSGGACVENIAAWIPQIVAELKHRGYNFVRLHHLDQTLSTAPKGILKDSPAEHWYELDATGSARLVSTIKELRRAGMWYTLDLNSKAGNYPNEGNYIKTAADANAIYGTNISTTVSVGANSATQVFASTAGMASGMGLRFGTGNNYRIIQSVTNGTTVVLTATVSSATAELVTPAFDGFKGSTPIASGVSDQLKAYASNLLSLDVSLPGESGVTIGTDPHLLYVTITNEHLPDYTLSGPFQLMMNRWYGQTWLSSDSAARSAYAAACVDWLDNNFRPWLVAQGWGDIPLAWGSQFGTSRTEYDQLKEVMDVTAIHVYRYVTGAVGETLKPQPPQIQCASLSDLITPIDPTPRVQAGPLVLEEFNSSDPNRFKAEALPLAAIWAALNDVEGLVCFAYADGAYNPSTIPAIRQYDLQSDRVRDCSAHLAASIYLRRDLNPSTASTNVNKVFEDRPGWSWGVDTERTIAFCGPGSAYGSFQRGQAITNTGGERVLSFVTTLDNANIAESRRLLIGHLTDLQRRARSWSDDYTSMTYAGSGNMCIRHGAATITFYSAYPNNWAIYRLNHDGSRGNAITYTTSGNLVSMAVAIDATNATLLYEAVVSGYVPTVTQDVSMPAGDYWADGDVSLPPVLGNYSATTKFADGSAGDTGTEESASGTVITVLHVLPSATQITSWPMTALYDGTPSVAFSYWDGAAWQPLTDTNGTGWSFQEFPTYVARTATFGAYSDSFAVRCVFTTDGGTAAISDSRVS